MTEDKQRSHRIEQGKPGHKSRTEQQGRDEKKNMVTRKSNGAKRNINLLFS